MQNQITAINLNEIELKTELERIYAELNEIKQNILPYTQMSDLLTVDEAAKYLRLSKTTIYIYVSNKRIPFLKQENGLLRFSRKSLYEWMKDGQQMPISKKRHRD